MGTFDMEMSPSAVEKSMEMLLDEMQQAGVSKAFTPFNNRGVGMDNEDYALLNGMAVEFLYLKFSLVVILSLIRSLTQLQTLL